MSCDMFNVWPLADGRRETRPSRSVSRRPCERAVILQSLRRFSDGIDSKAVDLWQHAKTRFSLQP